MTAIAEKTIIREQPATEAAYPKSRLIAGLIGRSWLWFLTSSVVISILPFLFGWSSYVIVTGSMEPSITAGDIVITSPDYDENDVLGRVISFENPNREGHILTHRVHALAADGSLMTKGDANPTPDSAEVSPEAVTGLGRLLVQFVGLPVVWLMAGSWVKLGLFLATVVGSVVAVARDFEPEEAVEPRRAPALAGFFVTFVVVGLVVTGFGGPEVARAAFSGTTTNRANAWGVPNYSYTTAINDLNPYLYWKLDETGSAATAADSSGNNRTGTYSPNGSGTNFQRLSDGALETDSPDRAARLTSTSSCINTTSTSSINAPQVFTVITWFRASSSYTEGGKMLGFERPRTGVEAPSTGAYDRHLYMDGQGRVWFGVFNNAHITLSSSAGLNDGAWHMAVGTMSSSGMRLYIDGALVGSNSNSVGETQSGWWRSGCGNLSGWGNNWNGPNNPGTTDATPQNRVFRADLDEVTVFTTALSAADVAYLYWTR